MQLVPYSNVYKIILTIIYHILAKGMESKVTLFSCNIGATHFRTVSIQNNLDSLVINEINKTEINSRPYVKKGGRSGYFCFTHTS